MHRKELWAVFIVVCIAALVLVYTAARAVGDVLSLQNVPALGTAINTAGWQSYQNTDYNFSIEYPPSWQLSTDGLSNDQPFISLGDPLNGTSTYVLNIYIKDNPPSLSAGDYVHAFLDADRAEDKANAASGPAPTITPQFSRSFLLTIDGQDAYELDNVFEFDHNAEQIYVADGTSMVEFDFPVADDNPNIALPARNNAIAHIIVNTFTVLE